MSLPRLIAALSDVLLVGSVSTCRLRFHEDESKPDFWYVLIQETTLTPFPGQYVNLNGGISANFLLDQALSSLAVQALFTINTQTDDISCHYVGPGKLVLPNVANSSGMKYGIIDIESSVKVFLHTSLPTTCPVVNSQQVAPASVTLPIPPMPQEIKIKVLGRGSLCDCGAKKLGYSDAELHGHGQWCKLVEMSKGIHRD